MPSHQTYFQRSEHLRHPLRVLALVFRSEGRLDVDHPLLEVGGEEQAIGFGRGVCRGDLGELLGKHCVKVPCSAGDEGVCRGVVP